MPKRGFNNTAFKTVYEIVNLDVIASKFNSGTKLPLQNLKKPESLRRKLVKVLAKRNNRQKVEYFVNSFSKTAKEKNDKGAAKRCS
jgi:large subunit ribosomal protein L15